MRSKSTLSLFMVESGRAGTACACPSCLLCYLNVVRNRRILSLIVFCRAHPRLKIGCLCRTGNGLASRAKRALFAACQPANPVGFTLGKQGGLEPLCACWGNLSPSPFERFLQNRLRSCGAFFAYGTSENRGVM